jgi:hypothetical protein
MIVNEEMLGVKGDATVKDVLSRACPALQLGKVHFTRLLEQSHAIPLSLLIDTVHCAGQSCTRRSKAR